MKLNSGRGEFAKKQTMDEILKIFLSDNFNVTQENLKSYIIHQLLKCIKSQTKRC